MVEKIQQPGMPLDVRIERRQIPTFFRRRPGQTKDSDVTRLVEPDSQCGKPVPPVRQPLHRHAVVEGREAVDEGLDQTPVRCIETIPFRPGRQNIEQLHLIPAAGHRVGEPDNRLLHGEATLVGRPVELDPIDCAGFAFLWRRKWDFLALGLVEAQPRLRFGLCDLSLDLSEPGRPCLDDHHAKIAAPNDGRAIAPEQCPDGAMALRPRIPLENHLHISDRSLGLRG
jgi:hypothetical protein